jgi:hypothetical protein
LIGLPVFFAVSAHLGGSIRGEGINNRNADSVQTARNLIGCMIKLTSGVQGGHYQFEGRYFFNRMDVYRDPPAIIFNRYTVVLVNGYPYTLTISCQGLINTVINHLPYQVVKSLTSSITNVHRRSFSDRFQPVQNLYLAGIIVV